MDRADALPLEQLLESHGRFPKQDEFRLNQSSVGAGFQ